MGWGLHLLGFHPFTVLGTLVLVNNLVVALVLGPFLLTVLHPRIRHARLLYRDLLGPRRPVARARALLGVGLVVAGTGLAFGAGELIASGRWLAPWAAHRTGTGAFEVGLGLVPFLGVAVAGLASTLLEPGTRMPMRHAARCARANGVEPTSAPVNAPMKTRRSITECCRCYAADPRQATW